MESCYKGGMLLWLYKIDSTLTLAALEIVPTTKHSTNTWKELLTLATVQDIIIYIRPGK